MLIDLVTDYGQDTAHWTSFGEQAFSFAVRLSLKYANGLTPDIKKDGTVLTFKKTSHMARCVTFAVARIRVGKILHIFPLAPTVWEIGDPKRLTRVRGQVYIYLPTKFGCDRSIVLGCRSRNDRQTSRHANRME